MYLQKNIKNNYGFFIFVFIDFLFIITFLLFYCKYNQSMQKEINKIVSTKNNIKQVNKLKSNVKNDTILNVNKIGNSKMKTRKTSLKNKEESKNNKNKQINIETQNYSKNIIKKKTINKKKKSKKLQLGSNILNNKITKGNLNEESVITNLKEDNKVKYNDQELNELRYENALKYDKRTYFDFYLSLLKSNHLLIFSFYINNQDYNPQVIKTFLFFFFFSLNFTVNALFFNDSTMHEIYIDEGSYNFIYQIPQIIYSSLISNVVNIAIKYLSLTQDNILELKKEKKDDKFNSIMKKTIKCIKAKIALFFIITFLLLVAFTFYITCFCGVYSNTQIHLIKDTSISFGLDLIYPFGFCLIPGIFRIISLKSKNKKCLYKFSQFIEIFL